MANKGLKRTLNEFQVRCPHRELGCEWVGELGKLDQHLNTDPQPERQLEGCPFTSIKCIHCKDHMRRHVIAGHQNGCPKRPYSCEYCKEYKSTFEDVANHWAECKCYLLPCPNNCHPLGSGIERQNLGHHVKEECPLAVVECDFHYAGCGVKLQRKDMAGHMKDESMVHISLLAAENQRLTKRLLERDEKMQQLMQQNTELNNRIDQQQRAYNRLACTTDQQQKANREVMKKAIMQKEELAHTMQHQQAALQELAGKVQGLQMREELIQNTQPILPIQIKMTGFKRHKDENTIWYSPPFYTHMCGYKLCLSVCASGYGDGEDTHVSVYTHLMRGEFDSHLKWPFRGEITIQLLNQLEDEEHHTMINGYDHTTPDDFAGRVTVGEKSKGWGEHQFIRHSHLKLDRDYNCQYLKFGYLIFRVQPVDMYM